jgi:hypothetical protein
MIYTACPLSGSASIGCSPDGFAVQTRAPTHLVAGFAEIVRVAIYKRDEIAIDLVCFEVALDSGDEITFHEELPGFDLWVESLERLSGSDADLRDKAIHPPFAAYEIIAYPRRPHEEQ